MLNVESRALLPAALATVTLEHQAPERQQRQLEAASLDSQYSLQLEASVRLKTPSWVLWEACSLDLMAVWMYSCPQD